MDIANTTELTEGGFYLIWMISGFILGLLFVFFVGQIIGVQEFKNPKVLILGFTFLLLMTFFGFLSLMITLVVGIPYFENFSDKKPQLEN